MKDYKIAIIDYGMGNVYSVASACKKVNLIPVITKDRIEIINSSAIILPGVGSFNEAMLRLKKNELNEVILDFFKTGKIIFGICLGMQLLFSKSFEFGESEGLNIIKGDVKKLKNQDSKFVKIPHIGWNTINKRNIDWKNSFLNNIKEDSFVYFVHSFFVAPENKNIVLSQTTYGENQFCTSIIKENIIATQFHPEKSGELGLKIYSNFKSNI